MPLSRFQRDLRYDAWANGEMLRHLQRESQPPACCASWLAHILGAQCVWMGRLTNTPSEIAVWPRMTLDELEPLLGRLREGWGQLLEGLSPAGLAHEIHYTNSKGQAWSNRVDDVLEHVILHGAHHRGQIASALREADLTPPTIDFIHAVRAGLLE